HDIAFSEIAVLVTGLHARDHGVARRTVELALLDEPIERLLDLADTGLREVRRGIDDDHVESGLCCHLGNALPHLTGAHHAECLDDPRGRRHGRLLSSLLSWHGLDAFHEESDAFA